MSDPSAPPQADPSLVRTDRLLLRRFTDADRAPFAALNADPVVMELFPSVMTRDESDQFVDAIESGWDQRGWGPWAIELVDASSGGPVVPGGARGPVRTGGARGPVRTGGARGPVRTGDAGGASRASGPGATSPTAGFVGEAGLNPADHVAPGAVEVGWRFAHAAWGHAFAPEAAAAALRVGFETLGLDEIVSFTVPANVRSRRVMEKIGLTHRPERDFDNPRVDPAAAAHLVRHVLYSMTSDEWHSGACEWGLQTTDG